VLLWLAVVTHEKCKRLLTLILVQHIWTHRRAQAAAAAVPVAQYKRISLVYLTAITAAAHVFILGSRCALLTIQ
jgi:hypothetical protein